MKKPDCWAVLGEPASPAEQAALNAFRTALPNDGTTRAWANLTFVDAKGRTGEIDVLLLSPVGFFLVELKGWHGEITGNTQRWQQRNQVTGAVFRDHPNPYLAADSKAKRLSSILKDHTPNFAAQRELPFLKPLVVLHGQDSTFAISDPAARSGVLTLDGYRITTPSGVAPLTTLSEFLTTPPRDPRDDINARRANVVGKAMGRAQFVPTPKVRRFGQYEVTERTPIAEGPTWQDVLVENLGLGEKRRLRIFDLPQGASAEQRQRIEADARREIALTRGLRHPGITVPLDYIYTDTGPALLFTHDAEEVPLDRYLAEHATTLTMDDRAALVRQLGEILRFAHERRLVHRSLAPRHVWVRPREAGADLTVRDWYTGQKRNATTSSWTVMSAGVSDVANAVALEDWLYLAPEALRHDEELPSIPLDVYGFAALSALILTGRPPAANLSDLAEIHKDDVEGGIYLGADDSLADGVIDAIFEATRTSDAHRTSSVREVLDQLEAAWAPAPPGRRIGTNGFAESALAPMADPPPTDPLAARPGDVIGGRFTVVERRGEGSSGTAFVVRDAERPDAKPAILKVAKDDVAARRLSVEADVLRALHHPRIASLREGPMDVGERRAVLLVDAGKETLAARIDREGRATIGQLESFGADLLELATYLDSRGIYHRDIKPANLGVTEDPSTRRRRLALFDFSLSREPLDNTRSGTRGYLDPYVGSGARPRYDRAAELWAVSATLFELATGEVPWWESGGVPASQDDPPVIAAEAFEPALAARLVPFFTKALDPDARRRFGSIDDLRVAWVDVFAELDSSDSAREGDDAAVERAELTTPLEISGLSARALSGLARTDAHTVAELLAVPPTQINSIPGLGETYRKEIQRRIKAWRARLGTPPGPQIGPSAVELVLERALDAVPPVSRPTVRALLGLDANQTGWASPVDVAKSTGSTRTAVVEHLDAAISAWRRDRALDSLIDEVVTHLARQGRVLLADDVTLAVAAQRGSTLDGAARITQSRALVRLAVEVALAQAEPQLRMRRRRDGAPVLALTDTADPDETGELFPSADDLLDAVDILGRRADELVADGKVVAQADATTGLRAAVREELGEDPLPKNADPVRLAAGRAVNAAVSGLGELYPRDLPIQAALDVALRARPGRAISVDWLRGRLATRFPELTDSLPQTGQALDFLVSEVLPGMARTGSLYEPAGATSRSATTLTTIGSTAPGVAEVGALARSLGRNSALTLSVLPREHDRAVEELRRLFGLKVLDVSSAAVNAARELAAERRIRWSVALAADAEDPASRGGQQLARLMSDAVATFWDDELASAEPLLLVFPGPLVRYGMSDKLSALLDVATPRLGARWLLVPREASAPVPMLEGEPVPLGPSTWLDLPPVAELQALPDPALPETYVSHTTGPAEGEEP